MGELILLLVLSGITSWFLTGMLRSYAIRKNLLDIPNDRSSHAVPMPRGGGLAIVVTVCLGSAILLVLDQLNSRYLYGFVGSGAAVALIGFMDDQGHVSPVLRLMVHGCAVIWGLYWLGGDLQLAIFGHVLELHWLGYLLLVVILVWILNLYNFMDGIDGIAASEAIFIAVSGLLFTSFAEDSSLQLVAILLIGATAGFLFWNWPPAKIFMGDVGSGFLGVVLGFYAYSLSLNGVVSFWSWLIVFGVFWVDATYTLLHRILNRAAWYEAHRSHAYQHAAMRWGHLKVTVVVSLINFLWLLPIAYLANIHRALGGELTLLALFPLVLMAFNLRAGKESC